MQWEIAFGQDGDIQRFAAQNLPTILQHLQMAQNLMSELTGQTPQGAAPEAADRRPGAETGRPADREAPRARGRETRWVMRPPA